MNIISLFIIFRAPGYTKAVCTSPTERSGCKMKIIFINMNHFLMISYDQDVMKLYEHHITVYHIQSTRIHQGCMRRSNQKGQDEKWRSYLSIWTTSGWYPVIGMLLCYIQSTNYYYLCSKMWVFSSVLSKTYNSDQVFRKIY